MPFLTSTDGRWAGSAGCDAIASAADHAGGGSGVGGGDSHARTKVGDVEVVSLLDGISMVTDAHFPEANAARAAALRTAAGFAAGPMPLPFNTFCFDIGGRRYLVDVGNNRRINPLTGRIAQALPAAGIPLESIDAILITHIHFDHVTGLLTPEGEKIFPHAELIVPQAEIDYWDDETKIGTTPAEVSRVVGHVLPVIRTCRDQFRPFEGTPEVAPGVRAVALYGHSPAQTGYLLSSNGQSLLFWADTVHLAAFQLPEPNWSIIYDVDPVQAVATRKRTLEMVAADRLRIAGAHLPAHGIGYVERSGPGYRFQPSL